MPEMTEEERQQQLADELRLSIEGANYAGPRAADQPAPAQEFGPEQAPYDGSAQQTSEPPAYRPPTQFPGLPVIMNENQASYNGRDFGPNVANSSGIQEAMAARARDAANPQAQAAFAAAERTRQVAPQPGDAVTPEMTSIQIREEMDRTTLSPADRLEMTQIQNGMARLNQDVRENRISASQAAPLRAGMRARLQPMQQMEMTNHQATQMYHRQKAKEDAEHAALVNAGIRTHDEAVSANNGPPISRDSQWVETSPRSWRHINEVRGPSPAIPPAVMSRFVIAAHTAQVNEILNAQRTGSAPPAWAADTPAGIAARELDREHRVNEAVRLFSGGGGGPTRGDAATQLEGFNNRIGAIVDRALAPRTAAQPTGGQINAASQVQPPQADPNNPQSIRMQNIIRRRQGRRPLPGE